MFSVGRATVEEASDDPSPSGSDVILFDTRTSLQAAADYAEASALFSDISQEASWVDPYGWDLATDIDGAGTKAMRQALEGLGFGNCGDNPASGGAGSLRYTFPSSVSEVYIQWKQRLGRSSADAGTSVGDLDLFTIDNTGCGGTQHKRLLVYRVEDGQEGAGGRIDHIWRGPSPDIVLETFDLSPNYFGTISDWYTHERGGETHTYTVYYKLNSSPGADDGINRMWVNGVLEGEVTGINMGSSPMDEFHLVSVYSDAPYDMVNYVWDIVVWEPS